MRALLALLVGCLAIAPAAAAKEIMHKVQAGETWETLAVRYFGSSTAAEFLRFHNHLDSLPAGATIRVPQPDERIAERGDSWPELAREHLGRAELAGDLAEINSASGSGPEAGARVILPMMTQYRVQPRNTMVGISRRFYGTPERIDVIMRANGKSNPSRLLAGERLRLPVIAFGALPKPGPGPSAAAGTGSGEAEKRAPAATPAAELAEQEELGPPEVAAAPAGAPRTAAKSSLQQAVAAYREGRYEESLQTLEALRPELLRRGSEEDRALLLRHLIFVYVAYDRTDGACQSYESLRSLEPRPRWDPEFVSPKIIRVVRGCNGG
jgi:LysM repeat protein